MTDDRDGLRIRSSVRAVVLDPADRVLLVRFEFPARHRLGDARWRSGARRGRRGDAAARARRGARPDAGRDRPAAVDPAPRHPLPRRSLGRPARPRVPRADAAAFDAAAQPDVGAAAGRARPRAALVDARADLLAGGRGRRVRAAPTARAASPRCWPTVRRPHPSTSACDADCAKIAAMSPDRPATPTSGHPRRHPQPVPALRRRLLVGVRRSTTASRPSSTTRWPRAAGSASPSPSATAAAGRASREAATVLEEVAASGACMNGASAIHLSIFGMHPVVLHGTEEMKQRYLPAGRRRQPARRVRRHRARCRHRHDADHDHGPCATATST